MKPLLSAFLLLANGIIQAQSVGIGTTTPAASAQLDISSTNKGLLPPRITETQRNAIATPTAGLMIWCTDCCTSGEMQVYNGTAWTNMIGGAACPNPNPSVTICTQQWMIKNLDVDRYRNGDPIPKVSDPSAWGGLTTGAYCYYNNDSTTYAATYGKLYNWYAVNDPRGLAPTGWHIPSDAEWSTLETCLGGQLVAGGALKESGTTHWASPNTGATNSSGWTGLPGGFRVDNGQNFFNVGSWGYWWSSSALGGSNAFARMLIHTTNSLGITSYNYKSGFSVRCLKD